MKFNIVTLFPNVVGAYINESILKKAQQAGLIQINLIDLRTFGVGKHRITDEPPFGGGGGMILKAEPIFAAVESIEGDGAAPVILMSPQGRVFDQSVANELVQHQSVTLICGRYEGFDERVRQHLVTDEISIGDYVLTGGELGAMVLVDAISRLIPGVLGADGAAQTDSHATGLLEGPHYTKPVDFRGLVVPDLYRSGNNRAIEQKRRQDALRRTWQRRPELLISAELTRDDKLFLIQLVHETLN